MKKTLFILIPLIACVLLKSCALLGIIPSFAGKPKEFTATYTGKSTGLNKLININGFYFHPYSYVDTIWGSNTKYRLETVNSMSVYMFYEDGIFWNQNIRADSMSLDSISKYITPKYKTMLNNTFDWGSYSINKLHTIEIQQIDYSFQLGSIVRKPTFEIISKDSIFEIPSNRIYVFHPLATRVDSTNWLLNKKWFWKKDSY